MGRQTKYQPLADYLTRKLDELGINVPLEKENLTTTYGLTIGKRRISYGRIK